ncbi:AAA family ATPase [Zoogloea sp.]|jgi:predicted ATPase|uniref:AAA family ATPase n=1 Tax=Zoogloea sp. TaxID=49181 RepID=UPI001B6E77F1|nr:AAA family ATPase [Zoogloea sp.]MBK6655747.1 AAA family ATPase [Zoogloea sp.]MBP7446065.1 AAA family ATPase [Zoogloea sp.]HOY00858.1 AAA family ATPase [Zoogloea sp.]HPI60858.1 AAA family ATPase [Zoogloea sp.]
MYIDRITLKNIRGFENLEFDLCRGDAKYAGWTVFTGDNGAGKSSLLKAIAVALTGRDVARSLQPSFHRWIREGAENQESKIELMIVPEKGTDEFSEKGQTAYKKFPATVILKSNEKDTSIESSGGPGSKKSLAQRGLWSANSHGWFSCGYGPFRRVFGASPEATRLMVGPTTERFVTMFQEAASLFEVDQWLRNLSHKKLEGKLAESEHLDLLLEILRDDLMPNQITIDRVDSDGLWLKDRNGLQLAWSEMSDGYRAALALLADILRHLINAYGIDGLAKRDEDGKLRIVRSGVVMIDEIDAHLHPEWQREIGFWLKGHFPNIQFLVTTHSPIICQAADENGLFVLPEPGSTTAPRPLTDEEYKKVIASRPDTILLTAAFGLQNTRSPRAVEGRAEYAKLMAKQRAGGKLSKAEQGKADQLQLFAATGEEL